MSPGRLLTLCLALATFGSFVWAVRGFFVRDPDGILRPGMRAIAGGGTLSMLLHLGALGWAPEVPRALGLLGAVGFAAALTVFCAAVGANRKRPLAIAFSDAPPEHIVTSGPYAYVRHPFYVSYALAWMAGTVATAQWWLLATLFGMGVLYVRAARREERMFASGPLALRYSRYRARTGMFVPRLTTPPLVADDEADPQRSPTP